jgi:tRNA uridine 5-carboxymethylaminomethyl modification enzyme
MNSEVNAPVVVIGAGHAGIEAAAAVARLGCDVVLITLDMAGIGRLSCNPAIGGIGKGHLVREIDALGGVMGMAADLGGIHFRVLNRSRGSAVHGPRAQQDYDRYPRVVTDLIRGHGSIEWVCGEVASLLVENGRLVGVQTGEGETFRCRCAVLTTGTFLRGRMFRGEQQSPGGRVGELAADAISSALGQLGIEIRRFKTGTPPRIMARTVDLNRFEAQPGDSSPVPFSFAHFAEQFEPRQRQTLTHLAKTNQRAHQIVRENLHRSPLYAGRIQSTGPRYCPSFEDKVVKFSEKPSHLLHLEPMGLEHPWIYINGLSTSLPEQIQEELVRSIDGLETAEIAQFGYAVEYDYVPPTQLYPTLELRALRGLFLAGQICGTTGYEEAAALGVVAGTNAALAAMNRDPWVPDRLSSYIGVMVDDLTRIGVLEPYRMFTSRAELRLTLAADTADRRLTPLAAQLGLVRASRQRTQQARWERIESIRDALEQGAELRGARRRTPADQLRRGGDPALHLSAAAAAAGADVGAADIATALSLVQYRGYLEREQREVARLRNLERIRIPDTFSFLDLSSLSHEARQRLEEFRPRSLGEAIRIPGINPAAVAVLAAAIGRRDEA